MDENDPVEEECVGDFQNNQVLDWTPISFSVEFIYRMRKEKKRLMNVPSTRQGVAIPKLLTAMYYRKVNLIPDDFIKAATITTPVEDQDVARQIAFEIIFPPQDATTDKSKSGKKGKTGKIDEKEGEETDEGEEESDFVGDLLSDILDSETIDLTNLDAQKAMESALDDFTNLVDFVDNLYDKGASGEEPFKSLLDILNTRGGYKNILGQGLNNLDALKKHARENIMRDINSLQPQDIAAASKLQWGQDVLSQSNVPWIKAAAQFCIEDPDFQSSLEQIMNEEEVGTAARTVNYLKTLGMDPEIAADLAKQLVDKSNDLMDILEIAKVLNQVPEFDKEKIFENSLERDLGSMFNVARLMDNLFDADLTSQLFNQWNQAQSNPTLPELFQTRCDHQDWKNALDNCVSNALKQMQTGNGQAAFNTNNLAAELMQLSTEAGFSSCIQAFQDNATIAGRQSLQLANSAEQFEALLRNLLNHQVPMDEKEVINLGLSKGVPEENILELFGGNYDLLKIMFEKRIGNFLRYQTILNKIGSIIQSQMNDLMEVALKNDNYQALGALGHFNLSMAFKAAEPFGSDAEKSLGESLSAGPGENLLLQWFAHRHDIPTRIKDFVRQLAKDALIKIALSIISNQRGSGEKGLMPTNKLRIFMDGDDMDLIDVEASIENIVMQGKSLNMLNAEDLMVTETEKGRVSICFLLDISGSMTGDKLAACSIAVMVLIGTLRAEEVAICFFESNTHVVKEFGDEKDLEEIADELMDLQATGGTQVQAALQWGARQLEDTITELKICFLLTDCAFSEGEQQIKKDLDSYVNQKVKFILGVNTRSYDSKCAKWILDATKGEIVYILHIMDIPKVLTDVLEKIG